MTKVTKVTSWHGITNLIFKLIFLFIGIYNDIINYYYLKNYTWIWNVFNPTLDLGSNIFKNSVDIISKLLVDVIHVIKSPNMGFFGMMNIQSEVWTHNLILRFQPPNHHLMWWQEWQYNRYKHMSWTKKCIFFTSLFNLIDLVGSLLHWTSNFHLVLKYV
jgi:hypothetical protein